MIMSPLEAEIAEQLREARSRRKEVDNLRSELRRRNAELRELADDFHRHLQQEDDCLGFLQMALYGLRREMGE